MQFKSFVIASSKTKGLETIQCSAEEAQFYTLFGVDEKQDAYYVGDFASRGAAEFVKDALEAS